jgi:hypothetical protein
MNRWILVVALVVVLGFALAWALLTPDSDSCGGLSTCFAETTTQP